MAQSTDPCYHTEFQKPLKDLRSRHNGKWVEVLVLDRDVNGQFDDEWEKGRVIAKFDRKGYADVAYDFAVKVARMEVFWVGGVLIR